MKAVLIWLVLISTGFIVKAQTYSSSCIPSGTMEIIYRNDACKLAIQRLRENASPFADSVTIPEATIDSIEKALYAVDNIQNALVDDTLRGIFGYANFNPGSDSSHIMLTGGGVSFIKTVMVTVNNNTLWGAQWLSGNYNATSNDSVNYLINNHHLTVELNVVQVYHDSTMYIVRSPIAINAAALAKLFEKISGVGPGNAYCAGFYGDGNSITAMFEAGYIKLIYSYGCGDCPIGCTTRRNWTFKVFTGTDCSVNYVGAENLGSPLIWVTSPCIDNTISTELCPGGSTYFNLNTYNSSDTLQWQVTTDGTNYNDIIDDIHYSGTGSDRLYLNNVPSAWYGYRYTCLQNGRRGKIYYTLRFANRWNGVADQTWENTANWSCGLLPDENTDVIITTGTVIINSDVTIRSLSVSAGASVIVAPGKNLTVLH